HRFPVHLSDKVFEKTVLRNGCRVVVETFGRTQNSWGAHAAHGGLNNKGAPRQRKPWRCRAVAIHWTLCTAKHSNSLWPKCWSKAGARKRTCAARWNESTEPQRTARGSSSCRRR